MKTKLLFLLFLASFSTYAQTNLVPNGGFENWSNNTTLSNWTIENSVSENNSYFTEGNLSAELSITNSTLPPKIIAQVPMIAGTTYTIKFKFKYLSANYSGQHPIALNISQNGSATTLSSSTFATDNNWTVKETTFTPDQNMFYDLSISLYTFDDAAFNVNIDAVQVYIQGTEQYTLIPDANFENKLISLGIDTGVADGKVLTNDINNLTSLNISSSSIADLTGIQDFVSLTHLDCNNNQLTTLNVSKIVNLTDLNCSKNKLTNLDLSSNTALIELNCYDNLLTSLNLKNGNNLNFAVQNSKLTDNTNLTCIQVDDAIYSNANWSSIKDDTANFNTDCATAYLYTYIPDVNFEKKLIKLGIDSNYADGKVLTSSINTITSLDVSIAKISSLKGIDGFSALTALECGVNQLTSLNLSKNTALTTLGCSGNQLTSLDLSKNTALTHLMCNNNQLINIDVTGCTALTELFAESNELTSLDLSNNLVLNRLDVIYNKLKTLNLSQNKALIDLNCNSNQLTTLDLSQNTALVDLVCTNNLITNLDLSNNYELESLDCSNNRLTELKIAKSDKLESLTCENNQLTTLNISNSTALYLLNFSGNQLTSIDLSQHKSLGELFCVSNQLTTLDVSKNTLLIDLNCSSNQLVSLNLKNGNNINLHSFNIHFNDNPNLSCIQVDNKAYSDANWLEFKDLTATYNEYCDYYTLIPDSNFEQKLIDLGIDTDGLNGKVHTSRITSLTSLDISESGIKSLIGIEDFVDLTTLNCSSNQLTALDVNKNKALMVLYCSSNQLTSLDISQNTALTTLYCDLNKLTALDTSNNTALHRLHCNSNQLTALDLSKNIALKNLICSSNQLTALDISNQKALWNLVCSSNQLTTLDVTKNTALWSLSCDSNQLTALDLRANTELEALYCFSNQLSALNVSNQTKLKYLDCSSNQINTLDVSKHKDLWNFSCNSNQLTYLNLKNGTNSNFNVITFINNPNLTCIQVDDVTYSNSNWSDKKDVTATYNEYCDYYTLIPDSNFEQKLIDLGIDTDGLNGKITIADINTITTLNLSNSNIKDLTGIENFTALNTLDCSNNQLTALDLSKNSNLQILYVKGNPLVYINLKNGNNQNLIVESITGKKANNTGGTSFLGLTALGCVKVDNVSYSNTNWSKIKETTTIYSETCTLGLEDSEFSKAIVYPNPTKGEVNILNIALEKATVYNVLGQLVKTFVLDSASTNNTINLSGLPKGVYFVYLINQDATSVKKVIVE